MRNMAYLCAVVSFNLAHSLAIAQSIPPGQVRHQIQGVEAQRLVTFRRVFDENVEATDISDDSAERMSNSLDNVVTLQDAKVVIGANLPNGALERVHAQEAAAKALVVAKAAKPPRCTEESDGSYSFRLWGPVFGCSSDAIVNFFHVSSSVDIANDVQYLYNAKQSTNQINADLFTGTFPLGFQAVLSGTATAGSSQPATSGADPAQTDSVDTAVSKLEQGGDFNLRFPVPLLFHRTDKYGIYALSSPAIGFNVSGLTSQNTITESTEYNVNVPFEIYFQTGSIEKVAGVSSAMLYADFRPSMELVSSAFATAIGLTSHRYFLLGQANAGIEFSGGVRVGLQYYFGPSQVYQIPTTNGSATTKTHLGGIHLVVSFSPK
jgi:hypothetical protein